MKVIIWGCGDYGKQILPNLIVQGDKEIIAYTDSNEKIWGQSLLSYPIISPNQILEKDFDILMVAVSNPIAIKQIKELTIQLHIPQDKVVDVFTDIRYLELFIDQRTEFIKGYADWIKQEKIEGSVAECGVFLGDSAKFINYYFCDRKLYLCDTFEGFDMKDLQYERNMNNEVFNQSRFANKLFFADTEIDFVMQKMTYPENILIKKGYFPESMLEVEDRFCFVNLDMDLYVPMLNGLRFFWDKMVDKGCILLHDYFSDVFSGVRKAVDSFEQERGIQITKTPIGDKSSIVLLKAQ